MERFTAQQLEQKFRNGEAVQGNYSDVTSISELDTETGIRQTLSVNPIYIPESNITIWQRMESNNTVQILKSSNGGQIKVREPRSLNGK